MNPLRTQMEKSARFFRVSRDKMPRDLFQDAYHSALSLSWKRLLAVLTVAFFSCNALFAGLYMLDEGGVANATTFADHFFFSVHTLATLGYGSMYPVSLFANILMVLEVICGVVGVALIAGIVFGKFSLPTSRVLFSEKALITTYNGQKVLMFRVGNGRANQIVEARVSVAVLKNETTKEGVSMRRFHNLPLVRSSSPIFAYSWTVMHPIEDESALCELTPESMKDVDALLIATLVGTDGTFSQTVHAQYAYSANDIQWGGQFEDILKRDDQGVMHIDYSKFHSIRPD